MSVDIRWDEHKREYSVETPLYCAVVSPAGPTTGIHSYTLRATGVEWVSRWTKKTERTSPGAPASYARRSLTGHPGAPR